MTLASGRPLSWHEFGDPGGSPVLYTAGTPMSGLGGAWYHQAARESGLRWISPDKPGYGGSGYQPRRSLLGWAGDLAALAGYLGLDQFALAGESGGGPFTLAAAHRLAGGRVRAVALIASSARLRSRAEREGQKARIRFYSWIARNAPLINAVPFMVLRRSINTPARRERALRRAMAEAPDASQADLRTELEAVADALRPGPRGAVQEVALLRSPWPFPLGGITTPVHLWHGARDTNVPVGSARSLASALPDATLHISDSAGHDVGRGRAGEITSVLASYLGWTAGQ
jgi:pimeloyl-ACP methyl ester carboxylesterase